MRDYIDRYEEPGFTPCQETLSAQGLKDATCRVSNETAKEITMPTPASGNGLQQGVGVSEAQRRKQHPMATGLLDYFPDALFAVAGLSFVGNEQHNPGQPLHWAKGKSKDHADALLRHLKDRGTFDTDGERHSTKVAWRALANLQTEIERDRAVHQSVDYALVERAAVPTSDGWHYGNGEDRSGEVWGPNSAWPQS